MLKLLLVAAAVSLINVICEGVFHYHPCASDDLFDSDLEMTMSYMGSPVYTLTCGEAMTTFFANYNRTSPCEMTIESDLFFASRSCCGKEGKNNLRCLSRDYNPCKNPAHFRFDHEMDNDDGPQSKTLCGYEAMYLAKISGINGHTTCDLTTGPDSALISNNCCGESKEKEMFKCAEDVRKCMMSEIYTLFPNEGYNGANNLDQHLNPVDGEPRGMFLKGTANVPLKDLNAIMDFFLYILQNQYNDEVTDHILKTISVLPVVMTEIEASTKVNPELLDRIRTCAPSISHPSYAGLHLWPYPIITSQPLLEQQFSILQVVRWTLQLPYEWAFGDAGPSLLMEEMEKATSIGMYNNHGTCEAQYLFQDSTCMLNEFFAFAMLTNMGADLSELPSTLTEKWAVLHIDDVPSLKNLLRTPLFGLPTTMPELKTTQTTELMTF